jgi:myo-inositol 2-dehydrogenase / D-chiro-inositol 1-dehydrogenase
LIAGVAGRRAPAGDREDGMVSFALFGCGRIGRMHAANIAAHPEARLAAVYDIAADAARACGEAHGAHVADSVEEVLADAAVDAVLIASSTDTHVQLITAAAQAGKAVLCEKPIDLDLRKVEGCWETVQDLGVPIMIGFNRRFDPSHRAVHDAIRAGEIGELHQVIVTSRDPEVPPVAYMKVAGGLLRDMTIHDFDLARFMLGEEPVMVQAMASVLCDPKVAELGDHDCAMITMMTASGRMAHISNHRSAVYGYDQRVEAIGSTGMLQSENRRATTMRRWTAEVTAAEDPLLYFFIERYKEAYLHELDEFIAAVEAGRQPSVGFEDGHRALILAEAAYESLETGRTVTVAA